ncbi:MAG: CCA tRNA nucleotidyltransferase, partial [Pseudomonadota bacterium]|nr:CCA tRNA nucleotidyltransferase [Pseudomonadota bacterium]
GGAVRDALLNRPVKDVDAATPLAPDAVLALLKKARIKALPTGIDHGTVTAVIGTRHCEITTLRRDVSTDGRHAVVEYTDDWQQDAARRDFTMNALYLSPEGELFDYFGGAEDARAGRVVFIGNPEQRISEDYLRILRFFRFFAWYGEGAPDPEAITACAVLAQHIESLSGERIREEMLKLLVAPGCGQTLEIMQHAKILRHALDFDVYGVGMFPRLAEIAATTGKAPDICLRVSGFVLEAGADIAAGEALDILAARWRLPNAVTRDLDILIRHQKAVRPSLTEAEQKRLLRKLGREHFTRTVIARWAAGSESIAADHPYAAMLRLADTWEIPIFPVTGDDLIAIGIKPGKELGALLEKLEEKWEKSDYRLSKRQLLAEIT